MDATVLHSCPAVQTHVCPCLRRLLTISVILALLSRGALPQPPNFCMTAADPPPSRSHSRARYYVRQMGGGVHACPDCSASAAATTSRGATFEANVLRFRNSLQGMAANDARFLCAPFAAAAGGDAEDTVYGLATCIADVGRSDCAACLADAAYDLPRIRCAGRRDMLLLYGGCLVRYGNATFFGAADYTSPARRLEPTGGANFSDPPSLHAARARLAGRMLAAAAESPLRLAFDQEEVAVYVTLHGMAQCTQDLPPRECRRCLASHMARLAVCCADMEEVRIFAPSCYLRYEFKPFLPSTPAFMAPPLIIQSLPPPSVTGGGSGTGSKSSTWETTRNYALMAVAVLCFIILLAAYLCKRRSSENAKRMEESLPQQHRYPRKRMSKSTVHTS